MLFLVHARSWLNNQFIKYAGRNLAHSGKCENLAAPQVGQKLNNGRKCHREKGGGQKNSRNPPLKSEELWWDKSKPLPQQKQLRHKDSLGHANQAGASGGCQTQADIRNAIAVHLCRDRARSNSHKGAITNTEVPAERLPGVEPRCKDHSVTYHLNDGLSHYCTF